MHRVGASAVPRHSIKRDRRRSRGRGTCVGRGCNVTEKQAEEDRRGEERLCGGGGGGGDRGAREQKNRRFFVQVNISARGPCLTGNALLDPSCTTKGSCCCCCRCRHRCSRCGCSGSGCYRRETLRAVARSSLSGKKTTSFSAPPTTKALPWGSKSLARLLCFSADTEWMLSLPSLREIANASTRWRREIDLFLLIP